MAPARESNESRVVLALGHLAGMLDLVILPLWVGGMMSTYQFEPQVAGGIVTLYLVGTLVANAMLSRGFGRLPEKAVAVVGFALPAVCFALMLIAPGMTGLSNAVTLAILHFIAGAGAGAGLVMVHGVIGRSANPHRLFAIVNFGLSLWAILFFALTPGFMKTMGVNAVFAISAIMVAIAALASLLAFPKAMAGEKSVASMATPRANAGILALCFAGVVMLQTSQAMTFSFVERIGDWRGFSPESVKGMLVASSFLPLLAPVLAGLLQRRLPIFGVAVGGLIVHGLLAMFVTTSAGFMPYALGASFMISTVIFTHCFIFGLLADLDPSGRTNAATPSMLMIGTAIGPILGGTIAKTIGYEAIGVVALGAALTGAACYGLVWRRLRSVGAPAVVSAA